jgi:hypothetical protein
VEVEIAGVSAKAEMVEEPAKFEVAEVFAKAGMIEESVYFEAVEEIEKRDAHEANSLQSVSLENTEHLLKVASPDADRSPQSAALASPVSLE